MNSKVVQLRRSEDRLFDLGSPVADDAMTELAQHMEEASIRGRYPLFFVGAGVSRDVGVPMMSDLLEHLISLVEKAPIPTSDKETAHLNELKKYCARVKDTYSRSDVSVLFGALQDSSDQPNRGLWNAFCEDFVAGNVSTSNSAMERTPLLDLDPSPAHGWIAKTCSGMGGRCVSLNFDGLTRKALEDIYSLNSKSVRAVILDSSEKIGRFYGRMAQEIESRDPERPFLREIIKLRGDVFYAICQTSGCPLEQERVPIYDLPRKKKAQTDTGHLLHCPECRAPRGLQISFPGYHRKELESEEILADLWTYIVPSTSALVVMGFSGEWDQSSADFLFKASQSQTIPIVDVRLRPEKGKGHFLWDTWRHKFGRSPQYTGLYGTCDDFAQRMTDHLGTPRPPTARRTIPQLGPCEIPPDHIWSIEPQTDSRISAHITSLPDFSMLRYYSQLGLKTYWWGVVRSFAQHNRYLHSIGAMRVADKWFESIKDKLPARKGWDEKCELELLRLSMLLHDYGHLPFSHLFEEIFDELSWLPPPQTQRPWHEVLTREKIDALFNSKLGVDTASVSEYLGNAGLLKDDITRLIDGSLGKPYLDAVVNSPLDADKIDYIFRDLTFLNKSQDPKYSTPGRITPLDPGAWLDEFLEEQEVSPEGFIRLNGRSAMRALELFEVRRNLYLEFYLAPELRVMERITSFILITYLTHFLADPLKAKLQSEEKFEYDHGTYKVHLASKLIVDKYSPLLTSNRSQFREGLLLDHLLTEVIKHGSEMDEMLVELMKALDGLLKRFSDESDSRHFGHRLHQIYVELLISGPYYTNIRNERAVREIIRELTLLSQGRVMFDVVKTPRMLAAASARNFGAFWNPKLERQSPVGEVYFVPSSKPAEWGVRSQARVPLSSVDFGASGSRYLQIILFDPVREAARAKFVDQQFKRACRRSNIRLVENPKESV